jgi:tRNA1Val (adenine37-N6)-methyltransferase
VTDGPGLTCDALLRGRLKLWQPERGPRVSLDSLLLADFAAARRGERLGRVLDLGCGAGVIALAMAGRDPQARFVGVELQPELAALARRNAVLNGMAERCEIVEGDLRRRLVLGAGFDLAVCNPPFHAPNAGRRPRADRAIARQELSCTIADVAAAARRWLKPRGSLALVFPADRLNDLVGALVEVALRPRAIRPVHSLADEPARRVLMWASSGYKGGVTVEPPLVVHRPDRRTFTDEARGILGDT